jgi:hypothetical protein
MDRVTKRELEGMLKRATVAGRNAGALGSEQELRLFVPWSVATIVVVNCDGTGGVRPLIELGGTVRELYYRALAFAVAWELVDSVAISRGRELRAGVS